jgi:hypothetical protein
MKAYEQLQQLVKFPFVEQFVKNQLGPIVDSFLAQVAEFITKFLVTHGFSDEFAAKLVEIVTQAVNMLVSELIHHFLG